MIYTLYDTCVAINQCQKRDKVRRDFKILSAGSSRGLRVYSGVYDDWLTDVDVEETNRIAEIVKKAKKKERGSK